MCVCVCGRGEGVSIQNLTITLFTEDIEFFIRLIVIVIVVFITQVAPFDRLGGGRVGGRLRGFFGGGRLDPLCSSSLL